MIEVVFHGELGVDNHTKDSHGGNPLRSSDKWLRVVKAVICQNKFLSRATAIVVIGPRQIGKPTSLLSTSSCSSDTESFCSMDGKRNKSQNQKSTKEQIYSVCVL